MDRFLFIKKKIAKPYFKIYTSPQPDLVETPHLSSVIFLIAFHAFLLNTLNYMASSCSRPHAHNVIHCARIEQGLK